MRELTIHLITPGTSDQAGCSWLSAEEEARAKRFVFAADGDRWRSYRSALRSILAQVLNIKAAEVPIVIGTNGKPALAAPFENWHFNLSHSDDLAALVISEDGPVGIDLEPWSRADSLLDCSEVFCHPDEIGELPRTSSARARRLLEIWTSKEAVLKALGTGLSYPPERVRIDQRRALADRDLDAIKDLWIHVPEHPLLSDYRLAVATQLETPEIRWKNFPQPD